MSVRRLGVLGGTFDPMHFGHLDAGDAAQRALRLDEVRVIPLHDPPHRPRDPRASAFHRFAIIALAVQDRPTWRMSDTELLRPGHSYTFDTLKTLQAEGWRASQIFFILGADAFAEIATWHKFPDVLDEAHFAVVSRPGASISPALSRVPDLVRRMRTPDESADLPADASIFLIEAPTRDVSSSEVRARLAEDLSIDDLVPPAVARHIVAHQLYGAVSEVHGEKQRTLR
jgi:nicotinate-nucleotide adenylyltransferase